MKEPNVKDYDLKPYGYIHDLQKYVKYLKAQIQTLKQLKHE